MKLLYAEEHTSCCHYSHLNGKIKNNMHPVSLYEFKKGHVREDLVSVSEIVFMLEGSMKISFSSVKDFVVKKGNILLLPVGCQYVNEMLEDSKLFVCRIDPSVQLCETFSLKNLFPERHKVKTSYAVLDMNERIWSYMDHTVKCLNDGLRCSKFLQLKTTELMYMFRIYYAKEKLTEFFYPMLNDDLQFAKTILDNCMEVKTKSDLAALTHLSPSRFGTKFKEVFGVSPYKWLLDRKSEKIYYELSYTDKPLKQISEEYKFSSVQHFNDFCKKHFGRTPGQVRSAKSSTVNPA